LKYIRKSSIIFGIQWRATCKFIEKFDKNNIAPTKSQWLTSNDYGKLWGNYNNAEFKLNRGYYTTYFNAYPVVWNENYETKKSSTGYWICTAGASDQNRSLNIYDFGGNLSEWSLERYTDSTGTPCVVRGSNYLNTSAPARVGSGETTFSKSHSHTSRVSLVVK